ncbi:hypothetical protein DY000_02059589 [Brassica cretica]|uniref:Uncharacterized protein n=1 Tax=Brassica cretica TaxID=69181 RepID=A0ABQ7B1S0_BRACR|nr:hypothetical protein DY000_02059589 [Brassica cretica]
MLRMSNSKDDFDECRKGRFESVSDYSVVVVRIPDDKDGEDEISGVDNAVEDDRSEIVIS